MQAAQPVPTKKAKPADKKSSSSQQKDKFSHPWLLTSLKGHSGPVLDLDLSDNGKYLASCSEDRSVLIWMVKEFAQKEHRAHRANVSYDSATKISWSPDSKAFAVNKASANAVEVYRIGKREDGAPGLGPVTPVVSFDCKHETDAIDVGIASTGQYIMSCSDRTDLIVWSLKGEVLARVDTCNMNTYCSKISPCGRFIATSGFTPDVKVFFFFSFFLVIAFHISYFPPALGSQVQQEWRL